MASLVFLINIVFNLLTLAIVARAFLSFLPLSPYHPLIRFILQVTEPILAPLRRYIPPMGMMDFTPLVAIILLQVIERLLVTLLYASV